MAYFIDDCIHSEKIHDVFMRDELECENSLIFFSSQQEKILLEPPPTWMTRSLIHVVNTHACICASTHIHKILLWLLSLSPCLSLYSSCASPFVLLADNHSIKCWPLGLNRSPHRDGCFHGNWRACDPPTSQRMRCCLVSLPVKTSSLC